MRRGQGQLKQEILNKLTNGLESKLSKKEYRKSERLSYKKKIKPRGSVFGGEDEFDSKMSNKLNQMAFFAQMKKFEEEIKMQGSKSSERSSSGDSSGEKSNSKEFLADLKEETPT